ncbi:ABC-2 transporter permease [Jidongwangia harbinensis]|uniref:ABC-2 transporter permease n=1 Tax=Jidongwangia harbinensis TaxID=2878561 RepID=UPI001CD969FE|nr:ABC-2 transporter permease [Jidongwangia harbinensis]MCA2211565.1 ABC-2 transporter permease [Jidongwangia harbinensis]
MRAIVHFVGLDLRSMRPNAKYMLIPVLVVIVPVLLLLGPYMLIPAISGLAVVSAPSSLFANDELGRLDTLYTALGIRRRQVVAGRYATCLLLMIALTVAGVLLAPIAALALGTAFDWATAAALAAGSVALVGIFLASGLPAYFGLDPGPLRIVVSVLHVAVLTFVCVGWAVPEVRTALLAWLGDANLAWLTLAAFAILGVLMAASTALSTRLYAQRDL